MHTGLACRWSGGPGSEAWPETSPLVKSRAFVYILPSQTLRLITDKVHGSTKKTRSLKHNHFVYL